MGEMKHAEKQLAANLSRADEEISYWMRQAANVGQAAGFYNDAQTIKQEIKTATMQTGPEIFTKAWRLCQRIEQKLTWK